jgi:hypothetical protein
MKRPSHDALALVSVVAAFSDPLKGQGAVPELRAIGIDASAVTIAGAGAVVESSEPAREAGFIWKLVLIIVAWSIVGTVIGAIIGVALAAAGVPPGGTFGVVLQMIAWGLFFHLMAGLWAGYALLTTGESRRPVARSRDGRVLVSVRCDADEAPAVAAAMRRAGATSVATYAADGSRAG